MKISLKGVTVTVGPEQRQLFRIPQLDIASGQKVLVRGESGQGKTTFLHLIAGLLLPAQGEVRLGETLLSEIDDNARARFRRENLSLVLQKLNLIDHLTVRENIELGGGVDSSEVLKRVGLMGREQDRVALLSLGEQQRVAVARVLSRSAPLILADEPTSSLDQSNAENVVRLLLETARDKTLIVVSHDPRIEKYFSVVKTFSELTR